MKKNISITQNIIILIVGIALLVLHPQPGLLNSMVIIAGALFALSAMIAMIMLFWAGRKKSNTTSSNENTQLEDIETESHGNTFTHAIGWICGVGCLGLGLALMLTPETFKDLWQYIFSFIIFFGGIYHFYLLLSSYRDVIFPRWFYIMPTVLVAAGVTMGLISITHEQEQIIVLVTGIAMTLFAFGSFMESICIHVHNKSEAMKPKNQESPTELSSQKTVENKHSKDYDYFCDDEDE